MISHNHGRHRVAVGGEPILNWHGLLERESELAQIAVALDQVAQGEGRLIVAEAAAGLGKSALLAAALALAARRGFRALGARGSELEREFPFGVVRQLLEHRLHALSSERRDALFAGPAGLSRPLFENVADGPASAEPDPTYATLYGLFWLTFNLAAEQPLAFAVDDAQWADAPSLRFLAFLHPRLSELPVALFVAVRTADPAAERADLARIAFASDGEYLNPRPLSPTAVEQLVADALHGVPAPALAAACHTASAGNPFYLHALLRELDSSTCGAGATAEQVARVSTLGPRAVSRAVLLRLVALAPEAPALARAVAVLGDGAAIAEAAQLAGLEEQRAARVADLLANNAILKRGARLEFVHPIVRAAVYNDVPPQERGAQHARAARILAGRGPAERVAAQLLGAPPDRDDWVVDTLRDAARDALAKGAPEIAARYLRRAAEEPPPPDVQAQLWLELGKAAGLCGDAQSVEHLRRAIDQTADMRVGGEAAFELGRALLYSGRTEEAIDVAERALARLGTANADIRARLEVLLVMLAYMTLAARRRVTDRLQRALSDVEQSADPSVELLATLALERSYGTGPAAQVAQLAQRALADERLLRELAGESPALYFATVALTMSDHGDAAERQLDTALAEARRRGSARGFAFASCFRGWTRHRRGNLSGAEADLRAFVEQDAELSLDVLNPFGLGTLIGVLLDRGDEPAADAVARTVDARRCPPEGYLVQELRIGQARLHLAQGRPRQALDEALLICDWEREMGGRHDAWTRWRPLAARAHAALGEHERAAAVAADAVVRARRFGAHDLLGLALHSSGSVAEHEDSGVALLEEAVAELELSHDRLGHATALIDLGAALRRSNQRSRARPPLRRGVDLARDCDAEGLAERGLEELRATGARPRTVMARGTAALTPSERRVARMAAEGLSNAQIAQALFVSLKTVETHLGNAYRKLDLHSRMQLPAALSATRDVAATGIPRG
jgi:DNA-binding CsgD family transcriptional regulator